MKRWWVSWFEPADDGDVRPFFWPLPDAIPAYWVTGWTTGAATLCAVVDAEDEEEAKSAVRFCWRPGEWRFCEEKAATWRPSSDRFPWPSSPQAE